MDNSTKDYLDIRDRIFEVLTESKMSQKEFALMLQVSPQTITDWKKGKSFSFCRMMSTIALTLKASPSWLIFGRGEKYMSGKEQLHLLESQLSHDVTAIRDAMDALVSAAPEVSKFSLIALAVAAAYDKADEGTQTSVRKLLDVDIHPQEFEENNEAM